jgi:hypothetical protein
LFFNLLVSAARKANEICQQGHAKKFLRASMGELAYTKEKGLDQGNSTMETDPSAERITFCVGFSIPDFAHFSLDSEGEFLYSPCPHKFISMLVPEKKPCQRVLVSQPRPRSWIGFGF